MRSITLSMLLILAFIKIQAQNYQIDFTGTGVITIVDTVKVENLSQCTSLTITGTDILNLTTTVGINESANYNDDGIFLFPNPSSGHFTVALEATAAKNLCIDLYDMTGKVVVHQKEFLTQGHHTFDILSIPAGIYCLKIESAHCLYSAKLISNATEKGNPAIKNATSTNDLVNKKDIPTSGEIKNTKGSKSTIGMQFNTGDTLKLTGRSGNYRTIVMLFPAQSQTVSFNFIKCTDADSNHYAVVQIGSQIWMQENLKTTKYRDGSNIPNVPDSSSWGSLTSGAYCNYHNDSIDGAYYGHLYNYYAVADSRKMCPIGWHVPSHSEWNIMEKFLDPTVDTSALGGTGSIIGRILKEGCNTRWQYYDSTYGFNSAGFAGLCSNYRVSSGAWSLAPNNNHDCGFWTSTSYNTNSAWYRSLRWCTCDIYVLFPFKKSGNSVRCIKD